MGAVESRVSYAIGEKLVVTAKPAPNRTQARARILGPFLKILVTSVLLRGNDMSALSSNVPHAFT